MYIEVGILPLLTLLFNLAFVLGNSSSHARYEAYETLKV